MFKKNLDVASDVDLPAVADGLGGDANLLDARGGVEALLVALLDEFFLEQLRHSQEGSPEHGGVPDQADEEALDSREEGAVVRVHGSRALEDFRGALLPHGRALGARKEALVATCAFSLSLSREK